eukprot:TRINITY_DN67431_c0_g1_i1.p1 TRINITY_DN67431_c0_g1~~TRINITY_DN67431_c0_g1_i1.p1  ORF type:complete len:477 (-),score=58.80 TRINITY_DN67431_c0_g1_i1:124-1554(-)
MPASLVTGGALPFGKHPSIPSPEPERHECTTRLHDAEAVGNYGSSAISAQETDQDMAESDDLLPKSKSRHPCFDIIRILCVFFVCVDHGGTTFGVWNVMFVQSWVLQYLFLTCGIMFGMSSRSVIYFVSRLGMYFWVGVSCNLCAWVILGKDWQHNMWDVIFQFWFIVALIVFVLLLVPIRTYCRAVRDRVGKASETIAQGEAIGDDTPWNLSRGLVVTAAGFVIISFLFSYAIIPLLQFMLATPLLELVQRYLGSGAEFWGLPTNHEEARVFIRQFFSYFELSVTNIYLVIMFPTVSSRLGLVVWLVLLNTYSNKMTLYRAQEARMINGFDCVMLGLVTMHFGMAKRVIIGKYMVRYWFVVLFICTTLWAPGSFGRLDEHPPTDAMVRIKYNFLEFIFVVIFFTALDRIFDENIFLADKLDFLGNWAMLLFLVHKGVHMLFVSPYNWFVLAGLAFPCWLLHPAPKDVQIAPTAET